MKLITAIVKPFKLDDVKDALKANDVTGRAQDTTIDPVVDSAVWFAQHRYIRSSHSRDDIEREEFVDPVHVDRRGIGRHVLDGVGRRSPSASRLRHRLARIERRARHVHRLEVST